MHAAILLLSLAAPGAGDYTRPLGAKSLDQAALDAEGFGEKKSMKREDIGLHVTLAPGEAESGWKTPQALRIGGDCRCCALGSPAQVNSVLVSRTRIDNSRRRADANSSARRSFSLAVSSRRKAVCF